MGFLQRLTAGTALGGAGFAAWEWAEVEPQLHWPITLAIALVIGIVVAFGFDLLEII